MKVRNLVGAGTLILTIVAVSACNNSLYGSGGGSCTPTATQVCMINTAFSPTNRTVSAGTTVQWKNGDGFNHTVTNDGGSAETFNQTVGSGGTFSHQFNNAGTFGYHCTIHAGMTGTITVNP